MSSELKDKILRRRALFVMSAIQSTVPLTGCSKTTDLPSNSIQRSPETPVVKSGTDRGDIGNLAPKVLPAQTCDIAKDYPFALTDPTKPIAEQRLSRLQAWAQNLRSQEERLSRLQAPFNETTKNLCKEIADAQFFERKDKFYCNPVTTDGKKAKEFLEPLQKCLNDWEKSFDSRLENHIASMGEEAAKSLKILKSDAALAVPCLKIKCPEW